MIYRRSVTHQDRIRAFCLLAKAALPSTWNWPLASVVTTGGSTPPRVSVKVWRFPAAAAPELAFPAAGAGAGAGV